MNPRDIFAAGRVRVAKKEPYFTEILMRLRVVEAPGLKTLGVDEHGRLYVDFDAVAAWGSEGTAAVLAHEVHHVIRDHPKRRRENWDPTIWNIAADCEINDDVLAAGWKFPEVKKKDGSKGASGLTPGLFGLPDGDLAEEYYAKLFKNAEKVLVQCPKDGEGAPGTTHGKCGSSAGLPSDVEENPGKYGIDPSDLPEGLGVNERETLKRRCAEQVQQHAKSHGIGNVPAGLRAWAEKMLEPPKVDWKRQMRAMVRRVVAAASGMTHRTWERFGTRYWSQRHVYGDAIAPIPSYYSPVPKVYLRLDTSGSMFSNMADGRTFLEASLSEIAGVLKACRVPFDAEAVDCDVHARQKISNIKSIAELGVGGGGTDMRVGLQEALARLRPDIFILMTDGEVPGWPTAHDLRNVHTVVCLVGPHTADMKLPGHLRNVVRVID